MKNNVMRIVVLALLLYALASFAGSLRTLEDVSRRQLQLQSDIDSLRRANGELTAGLENASDDEMIQALARERLALVMPGEKIFYFISNGE